MTTDSGGLLLRETDRRLNLLPRLAECFLDARNPELVEHSVQQLVSQRIYGLALGYEDLNDHEQLRQDPLLRVLAGKADIEDSPLAGKSTLNRLELSDGTPNRYKKITFWKDGIDDLLDKARFSASAKEQAQLWAEAQRKIATDVAAIPLYSVKYVLARNKRADLTFNQTGNVFYDFSSSSRLLRG